MFLALFANHMGEVMEHPHLGMLGRSGSQWVMPERAEMIPLPRGASLVTIPNRIPIGISHNQEFEYFENVPGFNRKKALPVAALLPQGFTRTLLPAYVEKGNEPELPLLGYAAVGLKGQKIYVAAIKSDQNRKWNPYYYNTEGLPQRIARTLNKYENNNIYRQLAKCSLEYGCFTAQNMFYQRWEGGIPTTKSCNARCRGCISEGHGEAKSPQNRLETAPEVGDIVQAACEHLNRAQEAIISFGQGCEGEPSLNAELLGEAIKKIRMQTGRGTVNMNTNGSNTSGIRLMCEAGLNAMRVTVFSFNDSNYQEYHRPINYNLQDVKNSIQVARNLGVAVSLNLLVYPGFTDTEDEIESLLGFARTGGIDMIQLRNLNIDPEVMKSFCSVNQPGIGMVNFVNTLKKEIPGVTIGSYTHPVN